MKPFLRLPVSAAVLAAVFLLGRARSHAADDEPGRHAAAESLLIAMHTEQMVGTNLTRIMTLVDRFSQSAKQQGTLTPEQTDTLKKAEDEARGTINKELGYDTIKDEFAKEYAGTFSEGELKELTAFYNSPIGQKLLEKQPAITDKVGQLAQQKMRTVMPGVVQKLRETAQKVLPPPPPPAVVPAPPVPPAPPAVQGAPVPPVPPAAMVPPTAPMPPTPPVPPTAVTPPVTTAPAPAIPTPLPSAPVSSTPSAQ